MDIENLRAALHEAVDKTIATYLATMPSGPPPASSGHTIGIALIRDYGPFDHRFPMDVVEAYTSSPALQPHRQGTDPRGRSRLDRAGGLGPAQRQSGPQTCHGFRAIEDQGSVPLGGVRGERA